MAFTYHKNIIGSDLHIPKVHAFSHDPDGLDPIDGSKITNIDGQNIPFSQSGFTATNLNDAVEEILTNENLWDRTGATLYPKFLNDGINLGSGDLVTTGKVGIGTDEPISALDINGIFSLGDGSAFPRIELSFNKGESGEALIRTVAFKGWVLESDHSSAPPIIFRLSDGSSVIERMRILGTNGNVGIGTDSPETLLEVRKDTSSGTWGVYPQITVSNLNESGDAYAMTNYRSGTVTGVGISGLVAQVFSRAVDNAGQSFNIRTGGEYPIRIYTNNNTSKGVTIGGTGNVIIGGASAAGNKLKVIGSSIGNAIAWFKQTNADGYGVLVQTADTGNDKYGFKVSTGGDANSLYVSNAGNVGIGTDSPQNTLHIVNSNIDIIPTGGSLEDNSIVYIDNPNPSAVFSALGFRVDNTQGSKALIGLVRTGNHTGDIFFRIKGGSGNSEEQMRITSGGNVGIGTDSPDAKLEVNGDTHIDGTLFFESGGLPFGHVYGNHIGWTQVATQNTWYHLVDANIASGELNEITHDGNGKLTVLKTGKYLVNFSVTLSSNAANKHLEVSFDVNDTGSGTPQGQQHTETKFVGEERNVAGIAILNLDVDNTIELTVRTTDTGTPTISVDDIDMTIVHIGG